MKRTLLLITLTVSVFFAASQSVRSKLAEAYKKFEADEQLRSAISSLYVIDASTGEVVFEKNGTTGLAPASTQKIITAATAYELLGKEYRYKTELGYSGKINGNVLEGDLVFQGAGDPTLGSWRWKQTSDSALMNKWVGILQKQKITKHRGNIYVESKGWSQETVPDGWIWQDIGNYYGAGPAGFNWRENQFDIVLASGNDLGSPVKIVNTKPMVRSFPLASVAEAAAKGTGDNAYVYYPLGTNRALVRGTIPVGEKAFTISASYPDAAKEFNALLRHNMTSVGIAPIFRDGRTEGYRVLDTHYSPPMDSIIYWFNRRSINLYGESLIMTIAHQKKGKAATDEGIRLLKAHWKEKGVDPVELNMVDGSGLSPLNRVTTKAQATILMYARKQSWYTGFYLSLPEFNNIKMKSGTIRGVKGFCGYHKAADGKEYVFSFLVNNYNGSASSLVQKMYKVLDELK